MVISELRSRPARARDTRSRIPAMVSSRSATASISAGATRPPPRSATATPGLTASEGGSRLLGVVAVHHLDLGRGKRRGPDEERAEQDPFGGGRSALRLRGSRMAGPRRWSRTGRNAGSSAWPASSPPRWPCASPPSVSRWASVSGPPRGGARRPVASTSPSTITPPGPLPVSVARSMPSSWARTRAAGEAMGPDAGAATGGRGGRRRGG
jgi:hypothetical protein